MSSIQTKLLMPFWLICFILIVAWNIYTLCENSLILCYEWWHLQLPVELKELIFIYSTRYRSDRTQARPASCRPTLSAGSLPGIKLPERVADLPAPSSAGLRMCRSYTCTYLLCLYVMGWPLPFTANNDYSYEMSVTEQLPEYSYARL